MIGVLEICECGREFLRGIYPQKKCHVCDAMPPDEPRPTRRPIHPLNQLEEMNGVKEILG